MKEETEENEWWEGEESLQDRVLEHCGERIPQWLVWNSQKAQHGAATSTAELLELLEGEAPVWRELYYNLILPLSESVDDVLYGIAYADREQRSARFEAKYCRSLRPDENEAVARRRNFAAILLAYALAKDVDDLQLAAFTRNAEAWLAHWSTHHPFREEAMEAAKAFHGSHAARVEAAPQPLVQAPAAGDSAPSPVYLSKERTKIDLIRVLNALYHLGFFTRENGAKLTKKDFFTTIGHAVNLDLSSYDKDLSRSTTDDTALEKHLMVFDEMKDMMIEVFNKKGTSSNSHHRVNIG